MDVSQQISEIEKEIRETPYHKATEHHIGKLRARIARLKDKQLESGKKGGGGGGGYAVKKQGDATVVLVGPPSAGKSTLINKVTNAESKVAPYAFTTVSVIPGMLKYKNAYIQILDIPGLIEEAKSGKGRGREVLSVARGADLVVLITDYQRRDQLEGMEKELYGAGIRLDMIPPNVRIEKKLSGGIITHTNIAQDLDKETIKNVASEFGIKNAEITIKENLSMERLIDSFSPSRVYIPSLRVVNKIDEAKALKKVPGVTYISADKGVGIEELVESFWEKLKLVRIYLIRGDENPSTDNPMIVRVGETLEDVRAAIGEDFANTHKLVKIWGVGARFPGQEVSLNTKVQEGMQIRFL